MKSFEELKISFEKFIPGIGNFIKGLFLLVFWETPTDLIKTFRKHWKQSKSITQKLSTVFAGGIIICFILYGFLGIYKDLYDWKTKEWRGEVLFQNYEENIKSFFEKYNERFIAHDCDFMAEVAADEAMFDKWENTKYDNYSCEEFVKYQKKMIVPIKIEPIQKTGDKYRVKGEALISASNQGEPLRVYAIYFDLWKKLDWDLWHFNNPKDGPRKIPMEILK